MEITNHVHLVDGVRAANSYLVTHPDPTLIDTGMPGQAKKILGYLAKLGCGPGDLKRIILTHHDVDHVGSTAQLRRLTKAEVCIHQADGDYVSGRLSRRPVWKAWLSSLTRVEAPQVDSFLADGQTIGAFRVVHTPGHTPGSISLQYGSVLFVGDLVRCGRTFKHTPRFFNQDSGTVRTSIQRITGLHFDVVCPGHGRPIFDAAPKLREWVSTWARGEMV